MHDVVSTDVAAGFSPPAPSEVSYAVHNALSWSVGRRSMLRRIAANDVEPLPLLPNDAPRSWWLQIAFSDLVVDGALHLLAHAIGFSGPVWHPTSRCEQSRFQLSLLLTQECIPVSAAVPQSMYGDPASGQVLYTIDASAPVVTLPAQCDKAFKRTHGPLGLPPGRGGLGPYCPDRSTAYLDAGVSASSTFS